MRSTSPMPRSGIKSACRSLVRSIRLSLAEGQRQCTAKRCTCAGLPSAGASTPHRGPKGRDARRIAYVRASEASVAASRPEGPACGQARSYSGASHLAPRRARPVDSGPPGPFLTKNPKNWAREETSTVKATGTRRPLPTRELLQSLRAPNFWGFWSKRGRRRRARITGPSEPGRYSHNPRPPFFGVFGITVWKKPKKPKKPLKTGVFGQKPLFP